MTVQIPTLEDKRDADWSDLEFAAEKHATREGNKLQAALEKYENDDGLNPYNQGGDPVFLPEHLGSGSTGEFRDDFFLAPLWLDGSDKTPCVHHALVRAFIAGANWAARNDPLGMTAKGFKEVGAG